VVAGGTVFVASASRHTVHALDAETGNEAWSYAAGARVDSPPTVCGSLVLFGSRDGHVYCLRHSDGALVWRFQAAPRHRWIVDDGQLESAWPVHGSVLVKDGLAYCSAGRSTFLDGGLYLYALEAATGKLAHRTHLQDPSQAATEDRGRRGADGRREATQGGGQGRGSVWCGGVCRARLRT
jgi:outer membrane protein assembly factor BamB